MAYSELIKNFSRIRDYMREFYVYGFKSRDEYTKKSARSYDDEKRRLESWLGEYMQFRRTAGGKNVFLSIDSRISRHNPLYRAWKTKSFTDGDITLHFIIMDILASAAEPLTLKEITAKIDRCIGEFSRPRFFDESTVRKKLKEYAAEGIVMSEKQGRTLYYRQAKTAHFDNTDILDFFSEVAPCGVIGSYLLDQTEKKEEHFAFKHHYITGAMDSEILCSLFEAMAEKKSVTVQVINRSKDKSWQKQIVPLQIMISVQNGRQYLMAYVPAHKRITAFRTDKIITVKTAEICENFDELRAKLQKMKKHMWGVSTQGKSRERLEQVSFTIRYGSNEQHIHRRLEREKRCGVVEKIDENTSRFSAEVYDAAELVPWIRTFICRIVDISFSDKKSERQFKEDIKAMYSLYGLEEPLENDFQ